MTQRPPLKTLVLGGTLAIAAAEERFRALVERAWESVTVVDRDGVIRYQSPNSAAHLGYAPDEVLGTCCFDQVHPEDAPAVIENLRRLGQFPGASRARTLRLRHKTAGWRTFEVLATNLLDHPAVGGIVLNSRDVTDRVAAERALQESEHRHRLLAENSRDLIWTRDLQFRLTYVSPAVTSLRGYTVEEALAQSIDEIVTPPSMATLFEAFAGVLAEDPAGRVDPFRSRMFELEMRCKDGSTVITETTITILRDAVGRPTGLLGVTRDISERWRAEQALREREAQLSAMIEGFDGLIYICSQDYRVEYMNQRLIERTGREAIGEPCYRVLHDRDDVCPWCVNARVFKGEVVRWEVQSPKDQRWYYVVNSPIRHADGSLSKQAMILDVTEGKVLEDQLRQSQKMEAIGQLAGGVAHDFNNLLTIIQGYSQMVLDEMTSHNPGRTMLEQVLRAATRGAGLTRQLLAFSRKLPVQPRVVNLGETLREMEKMLRRLIGEDVALSVVADRAAGEVTVDPGQIEQVVMNLAANARDAMPHGGRLTIEVANVEIDEEFARAHPGPQPGHHVQMTVADTGVGMDAATRARIFEPFFTTKEVGKGTGLGLSVVYGIVKQNQGTIWVESEPGRGSRFEIVFPRTDERGQADKTVPGADTGLPAGRETLLLVEDDDGVREVVGRALRALGYSVLEARHPGEALLVAERHAGSIDLLVSDIVMPEMSGPEMAERLRPLRPDMAVLFMSGYPGAVPLAGGEHVLRQYLLKPVPPATLAWKIREILDAPRDGSPPGTCP